MRHLKPAHEILTSSKYELVTITHRSKSPQCVITGCSSLKFDADTETLNASGPGKIIPQFHAFCSLNRMITLCTTRFNIRTFYVLPTHCVLCGSQNKQRLFPYTALTGWFLKPRGCVYCAVRVGYLNITELHVSLQRVK